jgi:hypothetical protein
MRKEDLLQALRTLNDVLAEKQVKGEICLYGGAVMCLAYDARPSTKDVDAVFHPSAEIRSAAEETGRRLGLPEGWLNDGVKGFLVDHPQKVFLPLSNLTVLIADAEYLFAMKALAARVDTTDRSDARLLLERMGVKRLDDALALVEKYYPRKMIKPATLYFLEDLFENAPDA